MNNEIRNLFPALERNVYLNSGAVTPLPKPTVDAINLQLQDVMLNGSANFQKWVDMKNQARERVARLLRVRSEQIAFLRNTSDGISCIANGLSWEEGENIVTFEHEFPANFYPWRHIRDKHNVELRLAKEENGRINIDEICSLIDENTKVVSISAVQFSTGFRADLKEIGEVARKFDALFCVDIIQAFGAIDLDLTSMNVDAAAGASHKWLCSPEGCGILYLSNKARERITPNLIGWISVGEPWDFSNYEQEFLSTALAFESGTGPSSLFFGLEASLNILEDVGIQNIESHLEMLTDYLCDKIPDNRYSIVSSRKPGEKSQIVCIRNREGIESIDLFKHLASRNIIVSPRGENLRIAPHFFNNHEDIDQLIENLP